MRKLTGILIVLFSILTVQGQTSDNVYSTLGMPGDNLNLYLVLNTFKQSNSVEEFEKKLNDPNSRINNLDLNNDGNIDYLKVTDYGKDDYHTVVIQDIISASETQDIAIIDIQKSNNNAAHIQIIGDESLYGKDYIIEPQVENTAKQTQPTTIVNNNYYVTDNGVPYVNVWGWPSVNFVFGNVYNPWVSPWHWAYYPSWWLVRPRVIYKVYYGYHRDFGWNYYCRRNYVINQPHYYNYYSNRRVVSPTVQVNVTKNVYHNAPRGARYDNTNNNYQNPKNNGGKWNGQKNGNQLYNSNNGNVGGLNNKPNNNTNSTQPKWNGNNAGGANNNAYHPNNGNNNQGNWNNNKPDKNYGGGNPNGSSGNGWKGAGNAGGYKGDGYKGGNGAGGVKTGSKHK